MQPGMTQKPIISFKVEGIHVHSVEICFEHSNIWRVQRVHGIVVTFVVIMLYWYVTSIAQCIFCCPWSWCPDFPSATQLFSPWKHFRIPMGIFARCAGQSHCAFNRVAPRCLNTLLSTLAGQLWSCQGDRSANARTWRLQCSAWLMGAFWWSAAEKLFPPFFLSLFFG